MEIELPVWEVIDSFFRQSGGIDASNILVRHQIESINEFTDKKLIQIIQGFNPIQVCHNYSEEFNDFKYKININIQNPCLAKPIYQNNDGSQMLMTPHLARMNNLSYSSHLYVDTHVITEFKNDDGVTERKEITIPSVNLGKIPIMVRSKACILTQIPGLAENSEKDECRYDYGGYFIINGNEKVIISQDRISENATVVFAPNGNGDGLSAEIRSMPDGMFLPPKTTSLHLSGKANHMGNVIRLMASFLKSDIPLFIMFRALGIESDKEIFSHIVLDIDSQKNQRMLQHLSACADDANEIRSQEDALKYLLKVLGTTGTPKEYLEQPDKALNIIKNTIKNDFLSHTGTDYKKKALYLGYMVRKLLSIYLGYQDYDNRDSYLYKRIDTPGVLFANQFRQCYGKLIKEMRNLIVRELNLWRANPQFSLQIITPNNIHRFFKPSIIESGMRYALSTGNWGVKAIGSFQNIRQGVAQVLNRMSYLSTLSHLRRINTPMEKNGKLVQPRKLENTQFGMICASETPEGSSVGLVKNMALSTHITIYLSSVYVRDLLKELGTIVYTSDVKDSITYLKDMGSQDSVLIMINGDIIGYHKDPDNIYKQLKHYKRYGTIPPTTGVIWNVKHNIIMLTTEAGRMCRPLFIVDNDKDIRIQTMLKEKNMKWEEYSKNKPFQTFIAPLGDDNSEGFIEYMDVDEIDKAMVAMFPVDLTKGMKGTTMPCKYTHCEIHPSLINGVLASNIPFMDHNQSPRNCYQCLWLEEPVYMANTSEKVIKDVTIGDNVYCFDTKNMYLRTTKVIYQYVRPCEKPMYRITVLGGRRIHATQDHNFMTDEGWKDVIHFTNETKLGIHYSPMNLPDVAFSNIEIPINGSLISNEYSLFLSAIGLYPITTAHEKLPVLMRMIGYFKTNGFTFRTFEDEQQYDDDAKVIGFVNGYRDQCCMALIQSLNIDDVIMECSYLAQREFFAGGGINDIVKSRLIKILKLDKYHFMDIFGIAYNNVEKLSRSIDAEYMRYCKFSIEIGDKIFPRNEWNKLISYKGNLIFLPITNSQFVKNNLISDITVESDFHSFIGGDGFAVSNSAMGKQAVGIYMSNFNNRIDTLAHILHYPQKPLVRTRLSKYTHSETLPSGINAIVAIMTHTGFNQEDSVMLNKASVDRGLFTSTYYKSYRDQCSKNHSTGEEEVFTKPIVDDASSSKVKPFNYDKLGEDGFVPKNTYVSSNDIIVGKVMPQKVAGVLQTRDSSVQLKGNDEGHVDNNYSGVNGEGYNFCKVRIRKYRKITIGDKCACYDSNHDVLTTRGWVPIAELTIDDKVASMVNNALVYQSPSALQEYDYKGEMICVKSNHVDLCVTPNHRMYYRSKCNGAYWHINTAEEIYGKRHKYKKNIDNWKPDVDDQEFPWHLVLTNGEITHFRFEEFVDGNGKCLPELVIDIDSWLTFYGIYIAEGSVDKYSISYATHKPRVQKALDEAVAKSGLKMTKNMSKGELVRWQLWSRQVVELLGHGHIAITKTLQDWVWWLTREQCQKLVHAMLLGDGGQMANGTWRYYTSSTELANDFQRLCLHAGYSCNKKLKEEKGHTHHGLKDGKPIRCNADYWVMTVITAQNEPLVNKNIPNQENQYSKIDFDGKVYCCTVPKGNGIIYVRRNGTPIWCGNSKSAQKGTVGMIYEDKDMPFTKDGIKPDIIMNPHAIPSRMTMGQLMECIMAKSACHLGTYGDSTPFTDCSVEDIASILEQSGYERYGNEILYNGRTGEQLQTEIFIGPTYYQRLKHMTVDKIHCLTDEHEVLTDNGWKNITMITKDDKVAILKNNKLVYENPLNTLKFDYEGKMYHISNQAIDLDVTINHRMYISTRENWSNYRLLTAEEIYGKHVKYKKDAEWDVPEYQFILPKYEHYKEKIFDMDAWITFFGIWMAEGWANGGTNFKYTVSISVNKQRVKDVLYDAVNLMGYKYHIDNEKLVICNKQLNNFMRKLSVGASNKRLPDWVWQLSREQSQKLINAMILGDGSYSKITSSTMYYTSSIELANDFQRLCLHAGWSGMISKHIEKGNTVVFKEKRSNRTVITQNDIWRISIIKTRNNPSVNHGHHKNQVIQDERIYDYNGKVYCLQVSSEVFMVRKNGKPVWTGNSRGSNGPIVLLTRQPAEGRARNGGLRFGEMERDCIVAHGAANFLKERMLDVSDNFRIFVCKKCGMICIGHPEKNIYGCNNCKNNADIVQVRIPYSMKLLMQELMTLGVALRIDV